MKKILILSLFLSANVFAGYDAWVKNYENSNWLKHGSYSDYGSCEFALQGILYVYAKKCVPN